jgi:hypothetical protein
VNFGQGISKYNRRYNALHIVELHTSEVSITKL